MPTVSEFFGIRISFNYRGEHNPPHFHGSYQGLKFSVDIHTMEFKGDKLTPKVQAIVIEWLIRHKIELLENWELAISQNPLKPIIGLDKE
jgi:hypothetical protein